jgi:hypothetical protein
MAVTRDDFERAVAAYWDTKRSQLELSRIADAVGAGTAGSVRGGKHFDAVAALLSKFFLDAGFPVESIAVKGNNIILPGYYRPTKQWDVVVAYEGTLVAAFEMKALGGPSFGNNYNNRIEEALGTAADTRRAGLADMFPGEEPWLGYLFIVEDAPGSRTRSKIPIRRGAFEVEDVWNHLSYQERCSLSFRRLLSERLYDAALCVASEGPDTAPVEFDSRLDWRHFHAAVEARIAYLRELGIPRRR